jgi:death on curing protein
MTDAEPIWLSRALLDAIHDDLVQQFGGASGINSEHLIESALSRPWSLHAYGGADVFDCAAAYAYGIAKNHGYTDANKRTGYTAALLFLRLNGWRVLASAPDATDAMVRLVTDRLSESGMAQWLRAHAQPFPPP